MVSFWANLRLKQRFMIMVGFGVITIVTAIVLTIARFEINTMERKLHDLSMNEITSLHALIVTVMSARPDDEQNVGIKVFNNWFSARNVDYPGKLWSVWGPKVGAYMKDSFPDQAQKVAMDEVDREALATAKPVGRFIEGAYRYSMPIVLGVTEGAKAEVCYSCHGGMGIENGEVIAVLSSSLSTAEENHQLQIKIFLLTLGGVVGTALAVLGVRWVLTRIITHPVETMTRTMGLLADGDTAAEIEYQERRDELGDMARAVEVFKEHMIDADNLRQQQDAERDAANQERRRALQEMADTFETTVRSKVAEVEHATNSITGTAHSMATRSERSGGSSLSVSEASQITTERSVKVAEATHQLMETMEQVVARVRHSNQIAGQAMTDANSAAERMVGLSDAITSIGSVVEMIREIAAQTNLLALNATIEAARAGEAGRGFAVVANEVKTLASQTSRATEEITRQVTAIQASSTQMRSSIVGVVDTIRSMDEIAGSIAQAVQQQEDTTREIATDIEEVAAQAKLVSNSVTDLSTASAKACAGTVRVIWSARTLTRVVEELGVEAEQFLHSVRNADQGDTACLFD